MLKAPKRGVHLKMVKESKKAKQQEVIILRKRMSQLKMEMLLKMIK